MDEDVGFRRCDYETCFDRNRCRSGCKARIRWPAWRCMRPCSSRTWLALTYGTLQPPRTVVRVVHVVPVNSCRHCSGTAACIDGSTCSSVLAVLCSGLLDTCPFRQIIASAKGTRPRETRSREGKQWASCRDSGSRLPSLLWSGLPCSVKASLRPRRRSA